MSFTLSTLPALRTFPSTTRAGVVMTPNFMMSAIFSTFSMEASRPSAFTAFSVCASSVLHFGQPVPRI
jgi:hypothetical protein